MQVHLISLELASETGGFEEAVAAEGQVRIEQVTFHQG
jgi:hypothetical protein